MSSAQKTYLLPSFYGCPIQNLKGLLAGFKKKRSLPEECLDISRKGQVQIPIWLDSAQCLMPRGYPVTSIPQTNTSQGVAQLAGIEEAEVVESMSTQSKELSEKL